MNKKKMFYFITIPFVLIPIIVCISILSVILFTPYDELIIFENNKFIAIIEFLACLIGLFILSLLYIEVLRDGK